MAHADFFKEVIAFAKSITLLLSMILLMLNFILMVINQLASSLYLVQRSWRRNQLFVKSYSLAGSRIGYMIGNEEIVGALTQFKSNTDYGVFLPIQKQHPLH